MAKMSEMKKIIQACRDQGFFVPTRMDGNGHYLVCTKGSWMDENGRIHPPAGEELTIVRVAKTPRRDNGVRNDIAQLRRRLDFKWKGH